MSESDLNQRHRRRMQRQKRVVDAGISRATAERLGRSGVAGLRWVLDALDR